MSLLLIITGLLCHAVSGLPGLFLRRDRGSGQAIALGLTLLGSLLGMGGALACVGKPVTGEWVRVDGLAVVFLLPVFLISAMGAVYGLDYWKQCEHPANGRRLRLFYGLMTASMAGVVVAADVIAFLIAWEVMALSAFFLVTAEDEEGAVREAGWIYLVTTHIGTLCLFALFAAWRTLTGTTALTALPAALSPTVAGMLFLLALVAFGIKAGVMPLHVWLPGAHAMAPSHVSALMSGVLIKIGIYGLVRIVSLLPMPPVWWGGLLLTLGTLSGVLGVVFALGQHDLKRLLAYHSIENIGIIVMGLGLALVGRAMQHPEWVVLGLAGALLHVWNHGLFKSLLFLSAGAVIHATRTREMDALGGLAKAMPRTALCFAVGAVAICGLPPLNGFVSEFMIYLGLFRSLGTGGTGWNWAVFATPALALIGGLAVACFVKAFGTVFLGEARSDHARGGHEAASTMLGPMLVLAGCCLAIGLAPATVAPLLDRGIAVCAPELSGGLPALATLAPLGWVSLAGLALCGLLVLTGVWLTGVLRRHPVATAGTWDCGYAAPSARMQYTSSSFAQMLVGLFGWVLRPQVHRRADATPFPAEERFESHVPDCILDGVLRPLFRLGARAASALRCFQAGSVQIYLFYIVVFLIVLLLWR